MANFTGLNARKARAFSKPKTGAPYGSGTKAWSAWAEAQCKAVLTAEQFEVIAQMNQSVRAHAEASRLLAEGEAEGGVRTDYGGMSCQIRMDWFDPHQGIVDLKTCDDLTWFEADARRYGYAYQLAFYRAVLARRIGLPMPVYLIAVEKRRASRARSGSRGSTLIANCSHSSGVFSFFARSSI